MKLSHAIILSSVTHLKHLKHLTSLCLYILICLMGCADDGVSGMQSAGEYVTSGSVAGDLTTGESAGELTAGEPVAGESSAGEPIAGMFVAGELAAGEPIAGESVAGDPIAGDPIAGEPIAGAPIAGESVAGEPSPDQPAWVSMCQRWRAIQASLPSVSWSGDANQCIAGEVNTDAISSALALTNFYRDLAGLNAVSANMESVPALQECALMMEANGRLSHSPPESWSCYTPAGASAAGSSNLAGSNAVDAIAMYMIDPGNETTLGHRRWLLSLGLESVGIGSSTNYSCMEVLHLNRPQGWVAFPSPGAFPIQVSADRWGRSVDQTGWSIQYDGISLRSPTATITAFDLDDPEGDPSGEGEDKPVEVVSLMPNFGSAAAINLVPQGWSMEAGKRYVVRVEGESESIQYEVDIVDCDLAP